MLTGDPAHLGRCMVVSALLLGSRSVRLGVVVIAGGLCRRHGRSGRVSVLVEVLDQRGGRRESFLAEDEVGRCVDGVLNVDNDGIIPREGSWFAVQCKDQCAKKREEGGQGRRRVGVSAGTQFGSGGVTKPTESAQVTKG